MANICDIHIRIRMISLEEAERFAVGLRGMVVNKAIDLDTPNHPLFDPRISRRYNSVELVGTMRWAPSDDEIAANMKFLLTKMPSVTRSVALTYSELGTPVYGVVKGRPGSGWLTDRYIDEQALNSMLTTIYAIVDTNDLAAWSAAEQKACAALLKNDMLTHENDIPMEAYNG